MLLLHSLSSRGHSATSLMATSMFATLQTTTSWIEKIIRHHKCIMSTSVSCIWKGRICRRHFLHWTSQRHNQLFVVNSFPLFLFTFCWCSFFVCLMTVFGETPVFDSIRFFMVLLKISWTSFSSLLIMNLLRLNLWRCYEQEKKTHWSVLIYKHTNSTIINLRQLDLRCMKLLTVASVTAVPDLIICICWCWFLEISFYRGPDWYIYIFLLVY